MQTLYGMGFAEWSVKTLVDDIEKATDGRVQIDWYSEGVLVPSEELLDALRTGTIEMACTSGTYHADVMPVGAVSYLPFSRENRDDYEIVMARGLRQLLTEAYAEQGAQFLGHTMNAPYELLARSPVDNLDALKELKIRCVGSLAPMFSAVGVSTTYIPGSELYTSLQTGVIDGCVYGGVADYNDLSLFEVAKHLVKPPIVNPCADEYLMATDVWNELPEDLQDIILACIWRNGEFVHNTCQEQEWTEFSEVVATLGAELHVLPQEDQTKLRQAAVASWEEIAAKGPRAAKAVELYKEWLTITGRL